MSSDGPLDVLVAMIASVPWRGRPWQGAAPPDVRGPAVAPGRATGRGRLRRQRDLRGRHVLRRRRRARGILATSLLISVAVHVALFSLSPAVTVDDLASRGGALRTIRLLPAVELAPPPADVARPAPPAVPEVEVSPELTVTPTTLEAHPIAGLVPPPTVERQLAERPTYIPYEVPPKLLNRQEIEERLLDAYPPKLRGSGIAGFLLVWAYVDERGAVTQALIRASSGHPAMDSAAIGVVRAMEFAPALNRDRPTGVWVAQTVSLKVRREARRRWYGPGH